MLLVERSGFGLNELLGANQCSEMECDICKAVRQNWEEQAATIEPQPAAGNATDEREQGRHWVKRERSVRIAQPVPDAKGNSGDEHHSPRYALRRLFATDEAEQEGWSNAAIHQFFHNSGHRCLERKRLYRRD